MPSVIVLIVIGLWSAVLVPPLLQRRQVRMPRPTELAEPFTTSPLSPDPIRPTAVHRVIPAPVPSTIVEPGDARSSRTVTTALTSGAAAEVAPADGEADQHDPWMPRSAADAQRRRVMVIAVLGAGAVLSLTAVPLVGPVALAGHLVVDLVLAAYGWMVHDRSQRARQRARVVRPLESSRRPVPAFVVDERFLDRSRRAG